jgi:hypothetical protein
LTEKRDADEITRFVLIPFRKAREIIGGESDIGEQLFAGIAATFCPNLEHTITGTLG